MWLCCRFVSFNGGRNEAESEDDDGNDKEFNTNDNNNDDGCVGEGNIGKSADDIISVASRGTLWDGI